MEKKREYLRGDEDDIEKAKYPEKSPLGTAKQQVLRGALEV